MPISRLENFRVRQWHFVMLWLLVNPLSSLSFALISAFFLPIESQESFEFWPALIIVNWIEGLFPMLLSIGILDVWKAGRFSSARRTAFGFGVPLCAAWLLFKWLRWKHSTPSPGEFWVSVLIMSPLGL